MPTMVAKIAPEVTEPYLTRQARSTPRLCYGCNLKPCHVVYSSDLEREKLTMVAEQSSEKTLGMDG